MSSIFNPTLVISMGSSAKKALTFLSGMLEDIPNHYRNLIDLYNVEKIGNECSEHIQQIIDEKLLSSSELNVLVDLGYKIRSENKENVKITVYLYWDVYRSEESIIDLVNILFNINYGGIDKDKFSGMSLFIIPILDKEWLYSKDITNRGIEDIEKVLDFISTEDNMINKYSKILLAHSISKDGSRISLEELEYVCAIIVYLNIIPSSEPPFYCFNKRLLKNEKEYKIGAIGISALCVFKEKLRAEFNIRLMKDLLQRIIEHKDNIQYDIYKGYIQSKDDYVYGELKEEGYKKENNINKICIDIKKQSIWNKDIDEYPKNLELYEEKIRREYSEKIKFNISEREKEILSRAKQSIYKDVNVIIKNHSLLQGKCFLEFILKNFQQGITKSNKEQNNINDLREDFLKKVKKHPNFWGVFSRMLLLTLFFIYSAINIGPRITSINAYNKTIIVAVSIIIILGLIILEYLYRDKKLELALEKYIDEFKKSQREEIEKNIYKLRLDYRVSLMNYLKEELWQIELCILNCIDINKSIEKRQAYEYEFENLVTDLLGAEGRKAFYKNNKKDIPLIYSNLLNQVIEYKKIKDKEFKDCITEFVNNITYEYMNTDFYNFIDLKWGDNKEEELQKWMQKAKIKSKELLQFNDKMNLEINNLFVGSEGFVSRFRRVLGTELNRFVIMPIKGKDIFTNCISIIKFTLGIKMSDITPFTNVRREDKK